MTPERDVVVGLFPDDMPIPGDALDRFGANVRKYASLAGMLHDARAGALDAAAAWLAADRWPSAEDLATLRSIALHVPVVVLVGGAPEFVANLERALRQEGIRVLPADLTDPGPLEGLLRTGIEEYRRRSRAAGPGR